MKIAVTYDQGTIFQHFGKTEKFKVYEIQNKEIISSEVLDTAGTGHEALAGFLSEHGVDAVICGGIGEGAQKALTEAGIMIYPGVSGDADEAVEVWLNGELTPGNANCDHHDHAEREEGGCGGNCGSGCGSSCGGGCGGGPQILLEGKNAGKTLRVHYRGTFNDGTQFDSSYDRNEPLEFLCGAGQMIAGFDKAVLEMEVGEEVDIHLMPEEAYGPADPEAVFEVEIAQLPGAEGLSLGQRVYLQNQFGQPFPVKVVGLTEKTITFDANHEMAGKELNFHIELVEIK